MQQSVSQSLSPGGGRQGFAEIHALLALHFSSCANFFRVPFYKTILLAPDACHRKDSGRRLWGEGERSRGGEHLHWLCRLPDARLLEMPFPRGLMAWPPLPAVGPRDSGIAPPWNAVLESSATRLLGTASTQKLSQSGVSVLFSLVSTLYDAFLLDLVFRT